MLSNVIESLNRITYECIQLLKPLTLVDGLSFEHCRVEYTELYLEQIRNASYLAITKMEQASAEEVRHLIDELRKINPSAEICSTHYKDADDARGLHRAWNREAGNTPCDTSKKHRAARKDTLHRRSKSEIRDFPTSTFAGARGEGKVSSFCGIIRMKQKGRTMHSSGVIVCQKMNI